MNNINTPRAVDMWKTKKFPTYPQHCYCYFMLTLIRTKNKKKTRKRRRKRGHF
jgi:hypothetical protein